MQLLEKMFNYLALLLLYHCYSIVGGAFLPNKAAIRAAAGHQQTITGYRYDTEYIEQDVRGRGICVSVYCILLGL